ncbi:MAG: M23 family metallopeptidase [Candidatus Aenigmarchaeota archaeon]|nr:M23 family metallopeptidase [Candidatus Aenigmarchaeota archaeon]
MSRYKKGAVPVILLIIILLAAMIIGSLFLRSFASSNTLGRSLLRDQKVIRYYYDTENMGTMVLSFLNTKQGEMDYAVLLGAMGASNFPLQKKNDIEKTLEQMATAMNKEKCYIVIRGAENTETLGKSSSVQSSPNAGFSERKEIEATINNLPVKGDTCITSPFGWRFWWTTHDYSNEDGKRWQFHMGIDLGSKDQEVVSVDEGIIDYIESSCDENVPHTCLQAGQEDVKGCACNSGYGNTVVIAHGEKSEKSVYNKIKNKEEKVTAYDFYTIYSHMNEVKVTKGQSVSAGDVLGTVGNSGKSTNYHLHFAVSKAPYEPEYRSSPLNYYNPCPLFSENSGLKEIISKNSGNCKSCEADCMENVLDPEADKDEIELCALSGGIKEATYIPLVDEYKTGTVEIACY